MYRGVRHLDLNDQGITTVHIKEAETNFEKYIKLLEDKAEKEIIISVNNKPTMIMKPYIS